MSATATPTRHESCGAKTRAGTPCKRPAGAGTEHVGLGRCKHHGGCTPGQIKNVQAQQARLAAAEFGLARDIAPHDALIEELQRTAGLVSFYGARAAELQQDDLHGPVGSTHNAIPKHEAHIWVRLHQEERVHFTRVAKTCVECGIAERQIKLAEEQGRLIATAIRGILDELGVADQPEVPGIVRRHLSLVGGAQAA
jgi:hypothetical protein